MNVPPLWLSANEIWTKLTAFLWCFIPLKAHWVNPEETLSKQRCVIKAAPSYTSLKRIVDREEGGILRGSLTNWLLDPSLMRCLSFTFLSSLRALSERVELNSTLQPLNKWLKAVWLWASTAVCRARGNTMLILSRGDSGKHTLKRSTVS